MNNGLLKSKFADLVLHEIRTLNVSGVDRFSFFPAEIMKPCCQCNEILALGNREFTIEIRCGSWYTELPEVRSVHHHEFGQRGDPLSL